MRLRVDDRSCRVVMKWTGVLNAPHTDELEAAVTPLLEAGHTVALDLSEVAAITDAGLQSLKWLTAQGDGRFRLQNARADVWRALSLCDLTAAPATSGNGCTEHPYIDILSTVRQFFPAPVSDKVLDEQFVQTVAQALDRVDDLKSHRPYLGERTPLDYEAAQQARLAQDVSNVKDTIADIATYLHGLTIWTHPSTQENVTPPVTIPAIVGQMFGNIYNPNIVWDEYSYRVAQAEVEAVSICAALVGYDVARASGVFTFGGTATNLYAARLGIEKAQPGAFHEGIRRPMRIVVSDKGHFAALTCAAWSGLGTSSVCRVPTDEDNSISLPQLEKTLRRIIEEGHGIACIVATMGTTDAFGLDNLEAILNMRDALVDEYKLDYVPHVHADAVIGWAWAVFNDYDFRTNPLGFGPRPLRSLWDTRAHLQALGRADSVGVDFHKTGFAPYTCSLALVRERTDFDRISRDPAVMPMLFQFGGYHPGVFTLEASRSGASVLAALANLRLMGKAGYRVLLGHLVSMAEVLRERLEAAPHVMVVNDYNNGPVTLFRVYPDGLDAVSAYAEETATPEASHRLLATNEFNRQVLREMQQQMEKGLGPALSMTDAYRLTAGGHPIAALKSYVMSPFTEVSTMDNLVEALERARYAVSASRSI